MDSVAVDRGIERCSEKWKAPAMSGGWRLMSGMDRHTATEHHKTAAEYRQTADEHVKTLKDFWKDFLVSGIFILAAIVIIFACLAWFAANNRVSATGSGIGAKSVRFTLESYVGNGETGQAGAYESDIVPDSEKEETTSDSAKVTTGGTSLLVTPSSNLNNNTSTGALSPGARGEIKFTVTPAVNNLGRIEIDVSRVIKTATGANGARLLNLLSGHLLYFKNCEDGYYSGRITAADKLTIESNEFEGASGQTTKPVTKTIYWVWPEYIQNFVLTGNAGYYKNLFAEEGDEHSPYSTMQTDINSGKSNFYYDPTGGNAAENAPNLKPLTSMTAAAIETCAELYNDADEYLGSNITYLQLRISAREC